MQHNNCLNCDTPLSGKFCVDCGQKADTHRISPGHFITHDLVHGVLHVDKGILYTLKQLFTRPGYAAKDYIAGKRVRYYNIFYLILLTVGFLLLAHGHKQIAADHFEKLEGIPHGVAVFISLVVNNFKYLLLLQVPIFSLSGLVFFNRLDYNYFEHFIIAGYAILGAFLLSLAGTGFGMLWLPASLILNSLILLFIPWVYYQATNHKYSKATIIFRMMGFGIFTFFLNVFILIPMLFFAVDYAM